MTCKYCGSQLENHVRFCKYCGERVQQPIDTEPDAEEQGSHTRENRSKGPDWFAFKRIVTVAAVIVTAILAVIVYSLGIAKPAVSPQETESVSVWETEPPATEPASILSKPDTMELTYSLTQEDVDAFYDLIPQCEDICIAGQDQQAADDAMDALDAAFDRIDSQTAIANVLSCVDTKDETASERFIEASEILTAANDAYLQMVRRIYLSDTPIKEHLFADWTQEDLDMLMAHTQEVTELSNRNAEILVQYRALDEQTLFEDMVPLYLETVSNYNRIANIYGYENFYAYAYKMEYGRDYSMDQISAMRDYAAKYLVDAGAAALESFAEGYDSLRFGEELEVYEILFEDFDESLYLEQYLLSLPEDAGDKMLNMFDGNGYFTTDAHALEGAFTTAFEDRAFCFFGPGYAGAFTVAHELGHYYSAQFSDITEVPLDLAETQSQGNEWLFLRYLSGDMSDNLYEVMEDYKLYSDIATILISLMVDAFEEQVYSHPDPSQLDRAELEKLMEEVCQRYGGVEYISENFAEIQDYWKYVVVESPVYYVSYAVSAMGTIGLYHYSAEDYEGAVNAYVGICETTDMPYLEVLKNAGLPSPFEETLYAAVAEMTND